MFSDVAHSFSSTYWKKYQYLDQHFHIRKILRRRSTEKNAEKAKKLDVIKNIIFEIVF